MTVPPTTCEALLEIEGLKTWFRTGGETVRAVDGVSLRVGAGKTVALVGESGCGKSVTALSIARLIPEPPGVFAGGSIRLAGRDVLHLSTAELQSMRGSDVAYVFQDPGQSLNPLLRVSTQLNECRRAHVGTSDDPDLGPEDLLRRVGLSDTERVLSAYPHELSGGMKQRVMLAIALACRPSLLIADEPTTALDVTVQAQILELLDRLQKDLGMAVLLITHNLGLVAEYADDVYVMYAGQVVESGPADAVMTNSAHPYTEGLIGAVPVLRPSGAESTALVGIPGIVPNPSHWPSACRFAERCSYATEQCRVDEPQLRAVAAPPGQAGDHHVRCWHPRAALDEDRGSAR